MCYRVSMPRADRTKRNVQRQRHRQRTQIEKEGKNGGRRQWANAWREWEIKIVSIIEFISVWREFLCCRLLPRSHASCRVVGHECVCVWMRKTNGIKMNALENKQTNDKNDWLKRIHVSVGAGSGYERKSRLESIVARTNVRCIYSAGNNDGVWHKWH